MNKLEFDRCESLVRNWLRYHPEYEPYENTMDMTSLYHSIMPGLMVNEKKCYSGMIKPFLKNDDNAPAPFTFSWEEVFTHEKEEEKRFFIKFYYFPEVKEDYMIVENINFELLQLLLNKIIK
jgi:hypothetical protein